MTPAHSAVELVEFCCDLCDELYWAIDDAWKIRSWSLV